MDIYFQVIGPNKNLNEQFIEKMSNKKFSELNCFRETTKMEFDPNAWKNYLILPDSLDLSQQEKEIWMEFIFSNNVVWVR